MNIILLHDTDFLAADHCCLRDERAAHIRQTLKSGIGDTLRVGKLDTAMGTATVIAIDDQQVELQVNLSEPPPAPLPITLLLALPRPKMLGRLLRDVTSFGIKSIHIFHSSKVEKSYWQTPSLAPAYVEKQLHDGLMQARDCMMPAIHQHREFRSFMRDVVPAILQDHTGIIADPFSPEAKPTASAKPVALAIGQEGGFTEQERQQFLAAGFNPLWLGERILRVEPAVHAAIGRLARW